MNVHLEQMGGQPLNAQGYRGWLYALQGDGEYLQNEFGLNGASHENMCFNCQANKSDLPYNDYRDTAKWRETVLHHNGTSPTTHLVASIPGIQGESFMYDVLHVLLTSWPMWLLIWWSKVGCQVGAKRTGSEAFYKRLAPTMWSWELRHPTGPEDFVSQPFAIPKKI